MGFTEKGDVRKQLHDSELREAIVKAAAEDPKTVDSLAGLCRLFQSNKEGFQEREGCFNA